MSAPNHDTHRRAARLREDLAGIDRKIQRMRESRQARARALSRIEAEIAMNEPFTAGLPQAGRRYIHGE